MKILKWGISAVAIAIVLWAIIFVIRSEEALLFRPKGIIARSELELMITNILLMLVAIVPAYFLLLTIAWRYHAKRVKEGDPSDHPSSLFKQPIFWIGPSLVVVVMAFITWRETHKLDPFRPLESDVKPLTIQVIALDWKWLFIYPEQGIASLNFVQFPAKTPIQFALSADNSPMNSFWIPQLSGQIYSMTGMVTQLHLMADGAGEYTGRAAEINGEGYASMTFVAKSTSQEEFDTWVETTKQSPLQLTESAYNALLIRSKNDPIALYSSVEKDLFAKVVMKPMITP